MNRVLLTVLFFGVSLAESSFRTCEPIRLEMCTGLGYNVTGMPNLVGHERQTDAAMMLRSYQPLIEYGCSAQLKFFLCSVFVPMCTDKVVNPIGPCRGLCEKVRSRCFPVLHDFSFPWPSALNCSRFPTENNHEHMCMEGPSELSNTYSVSVHSINNHGLTPCSKLIRANQHVYLNRSRRCVPYCNADILFDTADKNFAEIWLSIWAALCFVSTLAALLTFAVDSSNRGRYPEKPLVFLALCYALVSVGWGVRSAAGRNAVACRADVTAPGRLLLTEDGFGNANCAVVFLLLYYFGMAAAVWWVVLCGCWVLCAGLRWSGDRVQGLSSFLHLAAWGVPAAHTVAALVRRDVDADELTGVCFVGRQNPVTLVWLVLVPQTALLILGVFLLVTGAVLVCKQPRAVRAVPPVPLATSPAAAAHRRAKFTPDLLKLGVFAALYTIPYLSVVATYLYEWHSRPTWLSAALSASKPALWPQLVRVFMSLVVGITAAMWVWSPRSVAAWRALLDRALPRPAYHRPPVKSTVPQPVPQVMRYMGTAGPAGYESAGAAVPLRQPPVRVHSGHKYRTRSYHKRSGSETVI